jgi:transposase
MDKKIDDTSGATEATAPSARAHHAGDGGAVAGPARRLSAKRKLVAVQRLMRGESLDTVSRDLNVAVHRLSEWRDRVLMAAESALKERERDERDDEIARLQAKVGEITMANELLYAKIDKLEGGRPFARRRLRT